MLTAAGTEMLKSLKKAPFVFPIGDIHDHFVAALQGIGRFVGSPLIVASLAFTILRQTNGRPRQGTCFFGLSGVGPGAVGAAGGRTSNCPRKH